MCSSRTELHSNQGLWMMMSHIGPLTVMKMHLWNKIWAGREALQVQDTLKSLLASVFAVNLKLVYTFQFDV